MRRCAFAARVRAQQSWNVRHAFSITIFACVLAVAAKAQTGDEMQANALYRHAIAQSERASKLERRGKEQEAIDAYEAAGQLCEGALGELDAAATPLANRSPDLYYRAATSFLHAGRLLAEAREEGRRKDEDLRKAVVYLDLVETLEAERARQANRPINPEVWRVRNAAGYASFLRGELAQARLHYEAVLEMNPTYAPADKAIAEINKLERAQNEIFSPQGRTLNKEKNRRAIRDVIETLKLVRDIVTLGR
jgi:tetratricopeptide (TPR) repeat protein